jgi:glyoxylase-like metal-dependent hydrolase (beta-lactamase superfamily II)
MIKFDVAPGVHALVHGYTNCYVVEGEGGITLVDAGYPSTWRLLESCLTQLSRPVSEVRGLIITHGHFDHVGFASRAQRSGIPVWAHRSDFPIVQHPYSYRPERPRLLYPLTHPRAVPVLTAMVAAGALRVPGVTPDHELPAGPVAELPGQPEIIHTPGHTDGECVVVLPDRSAVLTGDALVTLDPYTGRRGPRIIAPAATHDSQQALASLDPLTTLDADIVLTGHGAPWRHGIETAVRAAHANGVPGLGRK